jgi:hypothetical protein
MLSDAEVRCAAVIERSRNQRSRSNKANRCGVLRWLWWLSGAETSVAEVSGVEVSRESNVFFYNIFQIRRNVKEVFGCGL